MIDHDYKFIFIHIPKTGGTSIECCLTSNAWDDRDKYCVGEQKLTHITLQQAMEKWPDCRDYFKFTFVRNPWDRLLSSYLHSKKYLKRKHKSLESYIKYGPTHSWSTHVEPQTSFIKDWGGLVAMDFIGRFENLKDDFGKVCKKIGVSSELHHHVFRTEHKHYSEYYDSYLKDYVSKKYREEIEYFNYEF